ncbi:MAG: S8 family peptidase [Fibrobacteres bacterium]|nr:S8 family peptidase [Fibrobacterota bacterium]
MPRKVHVKMDSARSQTALEAVQYAALSLGFKQSYFGSNVLVGVIDNEFDHQHAAFRDSATGKTRFVSIWDQQVESNGSSKFGYGAVYNREQLDNDSSLAAVGSGFHGTHVAGIAAGGPADYKYRGVAPKALLAGVRYSGTNVEIVNAISFLFALADSLKVPCVVNMSLGMPEGPHDGTSLLDRAIDSLSGPGRIICGAAGNEARKKDHVQFSLKLKKSLPPVMDTMATFMDLKYNVDTVFAEADIWGEPGKNFYISALAVDTLNQEYALAQKALSTSINLAEGYDTIYFPNSDKGEPDTIITWASVESSSVLNGKPHVKIGIGAITDRYWLGFMITASAPTTVHAWHTSEMAFRGNGQDGCIEGDSLITIGEIGGTAKKIVTVGAISTKLIYEKYDGNFYAQLENGETIGGIALFSSRGNTVDGRVKPDICAPGNVVVAPMTQFSSDTDRVAVWAKPSDKNRYTPLEGTSMATPFTSGVVALMLEANPLLNPDSVLKILRTTAIEDSLTGTVPNSTYGYGKINPYGAVSMALTVKMPGTVADLSRVASVVKPRLALFGNSIMLYGFPEIEARLRIVDIRGRLVAEKTISSGAKRITIPKLAQGMYAVRILNGRSVIHTQKIVKY